MEQALYPIREVSRLTGVNAITLRAWERRYGLVEPVRTESGHRLYTDEHIEVIRRAVELTRQGVAISQVKSILQETQQASGVPVELNEIANRLKTAALSSEHEALQQALDSLFIEIDKLSALKLLAELDSNLNDPVTRVCWESALLPRLFSRLRFAQQRLASLKNRRRSPVFYIAVSSEVSSRIAEVLCGIWLLQLGITPLFANSSELPGKQLLKELKCSGVVLLAKQRLQEFAEEVDYPALETTLITLQEPEMQQAPAVQMQLKTFEMLFAEPLNEQAVAF